MRWLDVIFIWLLFLATMTAQAFQGELRSKTEFYPADLGKPTETIVPRVGLSIEHMEKYSKRLRSSIKGTFEANLVSRNQPENYFADVQEAYIERRGRRTKLRLGWNTLNWGLLDIFSPMDVVNQRAYFYPLDTQKRGAPMLETQWNPRGWEASAVYIPYQSRPVLPSKDSRWLPRTQITNIQTNNGTALLPNQPDYYIGEARHLDRALQHNYGVNIRRQLNGLELRGMYFEGASSSPSMDVQAVSTLVSFVPLITQLSGPIHLHPIYYRTRTSGGGFTGQIGDVIVRGESVYQSSVSAPGDQPFSSWSWQHGLGLEKNWEIGGYQVTQLLNYYHGQYPRSASNLPTSGFRLFDETVLMGFRWAVNDETFFYGSGFYNITQAGVFWAVGYQTKIKDTVRWDISWRDISAGKTGLLKTYDKNDHALMELTYFF